MFMWWEKRQQRVKMENYQKEIDRIKRQQSLQLLELIDIAISGIRDIGVPKTEADAVNKKVFVNLFDESVLELQRYVSVYKSDNHCEDYELTVREKSLHSQLEENASNTSIMSKLSFLNAK